MIKPVLYKGGPLEGTWEVTLKLDGVRMLRDGHGRPVSRSGKPLHNLSHIPLHITDAEIFLSDWETSVSLVRSVGYKEVPEGAVYSLDPLDPRLSITTLVDPSQAEIENLLQEAVAGGNEGLVLREDSKWLKVKPTETYDVKVLGVTEGKGKYLGMVGALVTPMGKVSGLTDEERAVFASKPPIGETIEVRCMSLTPNGKFRHPRLVRVRWDK